MMFVIASIATTGRHVPPVYRAPRSPAPIKVDGDLDKSEWQSVPWTSAFMDIRGVGDAPPGSHPPPSCETKVKMMWDDEYLYIGALLHSSLPVISSFTERNSPIFHRDSDFEVFIDADASCHAYKELELNAANVVWNLMLTRPYADGGEEYSGRIATRGGAKFYEVDAQRTATRVLSGKLNDPDSGPCSWSVEIALAHSDTTRQLAHAAAPVVGRRWRINFSRVEKGGEINWTWAPQVTWDPTSRRYAGQVNMHLPDAWGYIEFAPAACDVSSTSCGSLKLGESKQAAEAVALEPVEIARAAALNVYYAQHAYRDAHTCFTASFDDLRALDLVDERIVGPCNICIDTNNNADQSPGFVAVATHRPTGISVSVTNTRLVSSTSQFQL